MRLQCPNCGDVVPKQIKLVAMVTCPSCATTLYLDGARLRDAGKSGEMHDGPQLFRIGETVKLGRTHFTALGQARFSYGRGWWDEFWGTTASGKERWVSVDEGDIVMQTPIDDRPPMGRTSRVGQVFRFADEDWRVTEVGEGECIAIRGSFGERLMVGDRYAYVNASDARGTLLSGEFWGAEKAFFVGDWFDPFEVEVKPAS